MLTVSLAPMKAAATGEQSASPGAARVEETTFKSVDAMVAGQWDFPTNTPAPLVVLIGASTAVDRNGLPPGYTGDRETGIYARLTKALVEAGFAVFRYDAPGTGRSGRGRFSTIRSTALEGYVRAVDHARIDPERVFLFGHSGGTEAIAGIFPRYVSINPPAGVILLSSRVGETSAVRVEAPTLIIVTEKNPDDLYQYGRFATDARSRVKDKKLETDLVTIPEAEHSLIVEIEESRGKRYRIHPRAQAAMLEWLQRRRASILTS